MPPPLRLTHIVIIVTAILMSISNETSRNLNDMKKKGKKEITHISCFLTGTNSRSNLKTCKF